MIKLTNRLNYSFYKNDNQIARTVKRKYKISGRVSAVFNYGTTCNRYKEYQKYNAGLREGAAGCVNQLPNLYKLIKIIK